MIFTQPKLDQSEFGAWRLAMGACVRPDGVFFRVWAPTRTHVEVVFEDDSRSVPLTPESGGFFSAHVAGVKAGTLYRYRLDGRDDAPDPYSRFQPQGPHGPSMVIDPDGYTWGDRGWSGVTLPGQILYELHIGAFTPEGTFASAAERLADLKELGVTLVELMPVSECPGRWNWGYDGRALPQLRGA
jgi:maltooligosyltrehalose trehalohydrolase